MSGALQASHDFLCVAVERLSSLPERVLLLIKYFGWTWGFVLFYLVYFSVQFYDKATDLVHKMPGSLDIFLHEDFFINPLFSEPLISTDSWVDG